MESSSREGGIRQIGLDTRSLEPKADLTVFAGLQLRNQVKGATGRREKNQHSAIILSIVFACFKRARWHSIRCRDSFPFLSNVFLAIILSRCTSPIRNSSLQLSNQESSSSLSNIPCLARSAIKGS